MKIHEGSQRGFTLLELMVAMLLTTLVTLIAAQAFRLALDAWERSADKEDNKHVINAVPGLLEKQLTCLIKKAPILSAGVDNTLSFFGDNTSFSFYSTYSPQGSPLQGLFRIAYVYSEDKNELYIFQRFILGKDDIKNEEDPVNMDISEDNSPVSTISGITVFRTGYTNDKEIDIYNEDAFGGSWERSLTKYPSMMSITLGMEGGKTARWIFKVGPESKAG